MKGKGSFKAAAKRTGPGLSAKAIMAARAKREQAAKALVSPPRTLKGSFFTFEMPGMGGGGSSAGMSFSPGIPPRRLAMGAGGCASGSTQASVLRRPHSRSGPRTGQQLIPGGNMASAVETDTSSRLRHQYLKPFKDHGRPTSPTGGRTAPLMVERPDAKIKAAASGNVLGYSAGKQIYRGPVSPAPRARRSKSQKNGMFELIKRPNSSAGNRVNATLFGT